MVGSVGSTSNLINMISMSYQQESTGFQGVQGHQSPPPPPPSSGSAGSSEDPLGIFDSVDLDSDGTISESEYDILTQGITEVTGTELNTSFLNYDSDGDGFLNGAELRSVLDEAGIAPPPPPPQQVLSAYEAQSDETTDFSTTDESLLTQLLEYLENQSGEFDITA